MFSSEDLYAALNVSAVTTLLDDYLTTDDALFDGRLIPQDFDGTESVNFYMSGTYNAALEYDDFRYSINCRSKTDIGSRTMAQAIIASINRVSYSDYYIVCSVLQTIPPLDDTDVYNTPVEATIKKR